VESFTVQGANHTSDDGGGFFIDRAAAVVSNTVIRNNFAPDGGGIWVEKWAGYPGSLSLINSLLLTNTALTRDGGGLSSSGGPGVMLNNVEVRGNTAQGSGGGLSVEQITITNTRILSNTSGSNGGGISAVKAYIYNSQITGNKASGASDINGGGVMVYNGELHLEGCTISRNRSEASDFSGGSGIVSGHSRITILNSIITGNRIGNHAVALWNSIFTLTNVLIADNEGAGVSGDENVLTGTMVNVTIVTHQSPGVQMVGDGVRISNSIVRGGNVNCSGDCAVTYSDIEGGWPGTGNISADPQFTDPSGGNYHLQGNSPAIDAGTPIGAPPLDLDGLSRDSTPDMGAYEWRGFRIFLPLILKSFGL
jgi:hypothetical protein